MTYRYHHDHDNSSSPCILEENITKYWFLENKVDKFLDYCEMQSKAYKTNNIAVYMGSDFTYENARVWFVNMDKLIR